jgi:hypothetical protein
MNRCGGRAGSREHGVVDTKEWPVLNRAVRSISTLHGRNKGESRRAIPVFNGENCNIIQGMTSNQSNNVETVTQKDALRQIVEPLRRALTTGCRSWVKKRGNVSASIKTMSEDMSLGGSLEIELGKVLASDRREAPTSTGGMEVFHDDSGPLRIRVFRKFVEAGNQWVDRDRLRVEMTEMKLDKRSAQLQIDACVGRIVGSKFGYYDAVEVQVPPVPGRNAHFDLRSVM